MRKQLDKRWFALLLVALVFVAFNVWFIPIFIMFGLWIGGYVSYRRKKKAPPKRGLL